MAYHIYLTEILDDNTVNYIELDTEGIDMETTFSIAEISDLSKRKDTISKDITFKGTDVNNRAFGSLYHYNRTADIALSNKLFFNYAPLRKVDCLVYEESELLLKGNLLVYSTKIDKDGFINYQCTITGNAFDFLVNIKDKLLSDIDFTDLQHRYNSENIIDSWGTESMGIGLSRTERFNPSTNTYSYKSFEKGSGFLYPYIDYGVLFKGSDAQSQKDNLSIDVMNMLNFRPAVYVKEYFDRIFKTAGYSYEFRASSDFIDKFNSLIIPDSQENLSTTYTGVIEKLSKVVSDTFTTDTSTANYNAYYYEKAVSLTNPIIIPNTSSFTPVVYADDTTYKSVSKRIMTVHKNFTSTAAASINLSTFQNLYSSNSLDIRLELCEREYVNPSDTGHYNDNYGFSVIGSSENINVPAGTTLTNQTLSLTVGERKFETNKQLLLRLMIKPNGFVFYTVLGGYNLSGHIAFTINSAYTQFPQDATNYITTDVVPELVGSAYTNLIKPIAPANIKQFDFIKSIMSLFNLYLYNEKSNPKHLIFQSYNDYYAYATPAYLKETALDWTYKIDYTNGWEKKSNLTIPKKYTFTYKTDSDFLNANYNKKFSDIYGTYKFDDALGIIDEKKIELIFSPSPMVTYGERNFPLIVSLNSGDIYSKGNTKPTKTNIRILCYNGGRTCNLFDIKKDKFEGSVYTTEIASGNINVYPFVSNYFDKGDATFEDLNFNYPYELYFNVTEALLNADTSYKIYYSNQTSELTNINLFTIQCKALLNETDIANLDLRVPVFIDFGENGNAYFKVLSVEYSNNITPATVTLQQISFSNISVPSTQEVKFGNKQLVGHLTNTLQSTWAQEIVGRPFSTVTVKVTYVSATDGSCQLLLNSDVRELNDEVTVTMNALGNENLTVQLICPTEEDSMEVILTIISTTGGRITSPYTMNYLKPIY